GVEGGATAREVAALADVRQRPKQVIHFPFLHQMARRLRNGWRRRAAGRIRPAAPAGAGCSSAKSTAATSAASGNVCVQDGGKLGIFLLCIGQCCQRVAADVVHKKTELDAV